MSGPRTGGRRTIPTIYDVFEVLPSTSDPVTRPRRGKGLDTEVSLVHRHSFGWTTGQGPVSCACLDSLDPTDAYKPLSTPGPSPTPVLTLSLDE